MFAGAYSKDIPMLLHTLNVNMVFAFFLFDSIASNFSIPLHDWFFLIVRKEKSYWLLSNCRSIAADVQ